MTTEKVPKACWEVLAPNDKEAPKEQIAAGIQSPGLFI